MIKTQLHQKHWVPQTSFFLWLMSSILYCSFFLNYDEHIYIYIYIFIVWKSAETEQKLSTELVPFWNPLTGKGLDKYKISLLCVSLLLCMCSVGSVCWFSLWPDGLQPARLLIHGILQPRILDWVAMPSSWGSSHPGIKPTSPASPALQADSWLTQPLGTPAIIIKSILITATAFSRHLEYYFKTKLPTHLLSW